MRRDLALLSLATTSIVVIAILGPIALLVRQQERATVTEAVAQRASITASLVAVAMAFDASDQALEAALEGSGQNVVLVDPEGEVLGSGAPGQGTLVPAATATGDTVAGFVPGGYEVAVPIRRGDTITVVSHFATSDELTRGVTQTWLWMGGIGLLLIVGAVWLSDRLGQRLVEPIDELADAAERMSEGDLSARVEPSGPAEIERVGVAFNTLNTRLGDLLKAERESVADLSHRLRTPIAALRLRTGALTEASDRDTMSAQIDRLEHEVDRVISAARSPARSSEGPCDLNQAVRVRSEFWRALAEDEDREMTVSIADVPLRVPIGESSVFEVVDILIENVFAHTPAGASMHITTGADEDFAWLEVADEGPGFFDPDALERGRSSRGSTGLGLDIVKRIAESAGGRVDAHDRPGMVGAGAVVRVALERTA